LGGDIAGARLAYQRGVPGAQAAASMVVDTTVGVTTQLIFVVAGTTLLIIREHAAAPAARALLIAIGVLAAAVATFVRLQYRSMFFRFANLARRLSHGKRTSDFAGSASAIDEVVLATYRRGFALLRANLLRLVAWAAGAGEIWLVMYFLSRPIGTTDAFVLESLTSGVRAVAFMVPGALGAFEGGFVLFGALLGLPAEMALAVSLSKRVRELLLGLPGLLVWQTVEGRYLLGRGEDKASSTTA
jgi:putative membrane protein